MKNKSGMFVCAALFLVASASNLSAQSGIGHTLESYGDFGGRWEGKFSRVPNDAFDKTPKSEILTDIAFEADGTNVKVFLKPDGKWSEVKEGTFHLGYAATNAVIFSISADLGTPASPGGWVETWNFTITKKDSDNLYVFVTHAVNNFDRDYDYKINGQVQGRWFHVLYGEMSHPLAGAAPADSGN